jgi:hypothetical protein
MKTNFTKPLPVPGQVGLSDRANIDRHVHALDLCEERSFNERAALKSFIQQAGDY